MPADVEIKGLAELDRALQSFAGDLAEKFLAQGVSAGAKAIQDAIRAAAPVRSDTYAKRISRGSKATRAPGFLRSRIFRRRVAKASGTAISYVIGPNKGAFYAHFVEFGHRPPHRKAALGRAHAAGIELGTRSTPAHPFIRPAFSASKGASLDSMTRNLRDRLAGYVRDSRR